jgi:predicted dehydrogenase
VIRLGLIGLGYWGPNYMRVLNELPDCELIVACDRSSAALDVVRSRSRHVRTTMEADEVISAEDVDGVIVATPTTAHFPLALASLEAGKHVLCEKPLAATVAECDELVAAADRVERVLFVGHTFLFNPAVRKMHSLVTEGAAGRVLYAYAVRTGLGPIRQDVNALWDLAPHDLSILLFLLGEEPISVSAAGRAVLREDVEDVVFAQVRFESGVIAGLHVSWLDPYKVRRVTLVGDQRMLVFDDVAVDEKLKVFDKGASYEAVSESARGTEFGEYRALIRDGDILIPKIDASEPLKEEVSDFLRCCQTGERPFTDGTAGRRIVAVLEAATKSLRNGGATVDVDAHLAAST